jgi:hypothetical protein
MCKVDRMRNPRRLFAIASLGCALGCGDNSKECGPGTLDEDGMCVPAANCGFGTRRDEVTGACVPDGSIVCSEGTRFDPLTGTCKIDPSACQDGTVLVDDRCADPTAGLTIDVQEGPEPNGLGIVEASLAQAGNITLAAAGTPFVVHGVIAPWRDADGDGAMDPDIDTFVVTVGGPVLLRITADGVHGLTAGFVAASADGATEPLASWRRFGIDLAGDTSKRQVYLPNAGTYRIAIGDTRTLAEYLASGAARTAPAGDYYVSITQLGPPSEMALPVAGNMASVTGSTDGDALAFYAVPAGMAVDMAALAMPSDQATASLVIVVNEALRALADETSQPARVMVGGGMAGDRSLIVVDHVFEVSPSPAAYMLTVSTTNL